MVAVAGFWDQVTGVQPVPPTNVILLTAALALVLVGAPLLWPVTRHAVTVAHEAGHAIAALLVGRRLSGIRLHSDTSGLTLSRGRPRGPGMVFTLLAGHSGPALLGLGSAALLAQGRAVAQLWGLLLLLALMLLSIRNLFGLWVVLVFGVAVAALTRADPVVQSAAAYTLTWFWLLAAPRTVLELARSRRRSGGSSDADQLAGVTRVPAPLWVLVLLLITLAAAAGGVALLLPELLDR
jgi:hypothetical protein